MSLREMCSFRTVVGMAVAITAILWVGVANAGAYVYWAAQGPAAVGRANLDGTGVNPTFIGAGTFTRAVAVDGQHVYWTDLRDPTSIGRASIDGTNPQPHFITGGTRTPLGVAVDDSGVYWVNFGLGSIGRANLDGTGVNQNFVTGLGFVTGVAVHQGFIYWTNRDGHAIGRASLDHPDFHSDLVSDDASSPLGIAVDDNHIYWTNFGTDAIGRSNLDGTGVIETFITGASAPTGVALDGQYVYWTNSGTRTVGRATLGGATVTQSLIAVQDTTAVLGVAVDGRGPGRASPSPSSLAFAAQRIGTSAPARTLRITNSGVDDLKIDAAGIADGNVGDFRIAQDGCLHETLASGTSCPLSVSFRPTKIGRRQATLTFNSDDPASPLRVALSGGGYMPQPGPNGPGPNGPGPNGSNLQGPGGSNPARQIRLITCKRATGGKAHRRCKTRLVSVSETFAIPRRARASLARKGRRYGTGKASGERVKLRLRRRLRPGRYTLTLRYRQHGHPTKARTTIAIGRSS